MEEKFTIGSLEFARFDKTQPTCGRAIPPLEVNIYLDENLYDIYRIKVEDYIDEKQAYSDYQDDFYHLINSLNVEEIIEEILQAYPNIDIDHCDYQNTELYEFLHEEISAFEEDFAKEFFPEIVQQHQAIIDAVNTFANNINDENFEKVENLIMNYDFDCQYYPSCSQNPEELGLNEKVIEEIQEKCLTIPAYDVLPFPSDIKELRGKGIKCDLDSFGERNDYFPNFEIVNLKEYPRIGMFKSYYPEHDDFVEEIEEDVDDYRYEEDLCINKKKLKR